MTRRASLHCFEVSSISDNNEIRDRKNNRTKLRDKFNIMIQFQ